MIPIDKNRTREIIASAYGISTDDVINPSLCIAFGKCVYMFRDAIERGIEQGMHLLYVKNFKKEISGWVYNLDRSYILYIDSSFFKNIVINGSEKNVKVDITSLLDDPRNLIGYEDSDDSIKYVAQSWNDPNRTTESVEPDLPLDSTSETTTSNITDVSFDPNFSFGNYDADQDRDASKITRLEYACLILKVPNSGKNWIDRLILQSRQLDKA